MTKLNPNVDFYFNKTNRTDGTPGKWQVEYNKLRMIILECGLTEELKWGCPCYTYQKGNVVLIHGFKEYCAILFFKGALLKDPKNILIQQTANVQSARQIRFTNIKEIVKLEPVLHAYIKEAIELEKTGVKVELKKTEDYKIPEEFQHVLDTMPVVRNAFKELTPGRQRQYIFYFSQPKLSQTRLSRIEKSLKQILEGIGLND